MNRTSIDISRRLDVFIRKGEVIRKEFAVKDSNGEDFDFSDAGYTDAMLSIYRTTDGRLPVLSAPVLEIECTLSEGSLVIDSESVVTLSHDKYIFFLWMTKEGEPKLWLNGLLVNNKGLFDGVNETDTLTISEDGEQITIQISGGSGSDIASTDDLPEGTTNLYFTEERVIDAIANASDLDLARIYNVLQPFILGIKP